MNHEGAKEVKAPLVKAQRISGTTKRDSALRGKWERLVAGAFADESGQRWPPSATPYLRAPPVVFPSALSPVEEAHRASSAGLLYPQLDLSLDITVDATGIKITDRRKWKR